MTNIAAAARPPRTRQTAQDPLKRPLIRRMVCSRARGAMEQHMKERTTMAPLGRARGRAPLLVLAMLASGCPGPRPSSLPAGNAAPLVEAGAAVVLDEPSTGIGELATAIAGFVDDPERRETAGRAASSLGRPDAAEAIVDGLTEIAGGAR